MARSVTSLRLDATEHEALRRIAEADSRTCGSVVRRLIVREAKRRKMWPGWMAEANEEPTSGRRIDS